MVCYGNVINTDHCGICGKVANYKDHTRGKYKVCPPHMPIIDPIDHCAMPDQFSESYSSVAGKVILLLNSPCVIFFIYNFSSCVIFHKLVSNMDNFWSVKENEVLYQIVDEKIPQRSVYLCHSPYNNQI